MAGENAMRPDMFQLSSGRIIHLLELHQYSFYEGVLEGIPAREDNRRNVEAIVTREKAHWKHQPFLIEPPERLHEPDVPSRGVLATIPSIACVGRFSSAQHARNPDADASELVVIWFQDEFALPIAAAALDAIRSLPWERCAVEVMW